MTIFTPKMLMKERDGQALKVEYYDTDNGSAARFYINEELVAEENYENKSIHWARDAAENWLDGIKTLNG